MGHFLDNGYDICYTDGDLGISVWQHILEIFITPSVYASPVSPAGGNFGCNLCGSIDLTKPANESYICHDPTDAYQRKIIKFLKYVLKRRSISFQQLVSTRFECLDSSVTILEFITMVATGKKYKVYTTLLRKTARLVAKYYHQYAAKISTEQICVVLYLTVAQLPMMVRSSIKNWCDYEANLNGNTPEMRIQYRKGFKYTIMYNN